MTEFPVTPDPEPGSGHVRRHPPIDVAVNLLWCVPGEVGGSEQYLARQLVGLGSQPAEFLPTLYCLPSFVEAHPELAERYPMVAAGITGEALSHDEVTETAARVRTTFEHLLDGILAELAKELA